MTLTIIEQICAEGLIEWQTARLPEYGDFFLENGKINLYTETLVMLHKLACIILAMDNRKMPNKNSLYWKWIWHYVKKDLNSIIQYANTYI